MNILQKSEMFGQKRKSKLSHQSGSKEQEDDYKVVFNQIIDCHLNKHLHFDCLFCKRTSTIFTKKLDLL